MRAFRTTLALALVSLAAVTVVPPATASPDSSGVGSIHEFSIPGNTPADLLDITMGPDGNIWFTEGGRLAVGRMTPTGQYTEFPVQTELLNHITAGPLGAVWIPTREGHLLAMNTSGQVIKDFVVGEFPWEPDVTAGPDGNIWVGDSPVKRVNPVTGDVTPYNSSGDYITAGPDGNIWSVVAWDTNDSRIYRISPNGDVAEFPIPPSDSGITHVLGITGGPDGNVWFTDNTGARIGKITHDGVITMFPNFPGGLYDITGGPDGNVWATVYNAARIVRVSPDGSRTGYALPAPFAGPIAITRGPKNTVWFAEHGANGVPANRVGYIKVCGGNECSLPSTSKPK